MEDPVCVNGLNYNKKSIIKFGNKNGWKCPKGEPFEIKDVKQVPDSLQNLCFLARTHGDRQFIHMMQDNPAVLDSMYNNEKHVLEAW